MSKFRKTRKLRPAKKVEIRFRKELQAHLKKLILSVEKNIIPVLEKNKGKLSLLDSKLIKDSYIDEVSDALAEISGDLTKLNELDSVIAKSLVNYSLKVSDNKLLKEAKRLGYAPPGLKRLIKNEKIDGVLKASILENSELITNMSNDYMKKIKSAITKNYQSAVFEGKGGLIKELMRVSRVAEKRAAMIARDQTNKINASITRVRAENLGSVGYQWDTVDDERVRGNPNGKYSNVSSARNHWKREGKYFLWSDWTGSSKTRPIAPDGKPFRDPPAEGNPGIPVNCRCSALPVFLD